MPFAQSLDQIIVNWNRFLRGFRLADTNNVLHDGARYVNLFGVEVYVFPFQCEELTPSQARSYGQQSGYLVPCGVWRLAEPTEWGCGRRGRDGDRD